MCSYKQYNYQCCLHFITLTAIHRSTSHLRLWFVIFMTDTWLVKCCTIIIVTDPMLCFLRPEKSTAQFQNLLFYISSIALVLQFLFILVSSHLIWLLPTLWHWIAYNVLMCCLLGQCNIKWKQCSRLYLIVGADVEHHRQTLLRGNAAHCCVQRQLPGGDSHAAGTEIAESQNPLPVSNHHCLATNNNHCLATNVQPAVLPGNETWEKTFLSCLFGWALAKSGWAGAP